MSTHTTGKPTYSQQLSNPKWQECRLRILNRDGFACFYCNDKDSPLHVHHLTYENGKSAWDYPDNNFITLCETCHSIEHLSKRTELEVILINSCIQLYKVSDLESRAKFRKAIADFSKLQKQRG